MPLGVCDVYRVMFGVGRGEDMLMVFGGGVN
jgi:hypothetical protein